MLYELVHLLTWGIAPSSGGLNTCLYFLKYSSKFCVLGEAGSSLER